MRLSQSIYRGIILFLVTLSFVSSILAGDGSLELQQQDVPFKLKQIDDPVPLREQAKTIPISDTMVTLQITVDDNESFQATQCEAGMIRIKKESGEIFGLTPYITDYVTNAVSVKMFSIIRIIKAGTVVGEGINELEIIPVYKDSVRSMSRIPNINTRFSLQLINVKEGSNPKQKKVSFLKGAFGAQDIIPEFGGTCCVTCNGITTCACAVNASCGSCCTGNCCN